MSINYQQEVQKLLELVPSEHQVEYLTVLFRGELTSSLTKAAVAHPGILLAVDRGFALLRGTEC